MSVTISSGRSLMVFAVGDCAAENASEVRSAVSWSESRVQRARALKTRHFRVIARHSMPIETRNEP